GAGSPPWCCGSRGEGVTQKNAGGSLPDGRRAASACRRFLAQKNIRAALAGGPEYQAYLRVPSIPSVAWYSKAVPPRTVKSRKLSAPAPRRKACRGWFLEPSSSLSSERPVASLAVHKKRRSSLPVMQAARQTFR